jgi:hypothetical protein
MRAVGYSLETAVADIVDNSISAEASRIDILFDGGIDEPHVAILDDGIGMSPERALEAMRLAGASPFASRGENDLGRFGLGMKTASLSQCRILTIVTKADNVVSALTWDLDLIEESGEWRLLIHDQSEMRGIPYVDELDMRPSGTLVLWRGLDRLIEGAPHTGRHLDAKMVSVRDHLSLVFHRFLAGEQVKKVKIYTNFTEVSPIDPFLSRAGRTQSSPVEFLDIEGSRVSVRAFTLPFANKMSRAEREMATSQGSLRDTQGFYVYRANRLVIWGTWFRLTQRTELGRLTRVRVDVPNSLDHLWNLDIKKSSAVPPLVIRDRLRELAARFVEPSERAHRFRGRNLAADDSVSRMWEIIESRDSTLYRINRSHPAVTRLTDSMSADQLDMLQAVFGIVESAYPVQDMFNRMSTSAAGGLADVDLGALEFTLVELWRLGSHAVDAEIFFESMTAGEPFNLLLDRRTEIIQSLKGVVANG